MTQFSTLIPFGREALLRADAVAPAAGVLNDRGVALFYQASAGGPLEAQRFGLFGGPRGPVVDLGPLDTPSGGGVGEADVAALKGGGYVVAWTEAFSQATDSRYAVVDEDDRLVIVDDFGTSGRTSGLAATGLPGGGFALVETRSGILGEFADLRFQRYTAEGDPSGNLLTLGARSGAPGSLSYSSPQAVAVAGGVEVLWIARDGVHAGLVENDDSFVERTISQGQAFDLDAARLSDGRVVATWAEPNGEDAFVMAAVFDSSKPATAPKEFVVGEADVSASEVDAQVTALRSGGWAVSWHEGDPDGSTVARTFGRHGGGGREFDARGDFLGLDAHGRVLSLRTADEGDTFLARYFELSLPFFIPGVDRFGHPLQEWAI